MKKRKFRKGEKIFDPVDALEAILSGKYLFWQDKPQHPGWMISMQLANIVGAVKLGLISHALPND